MKTRLFTLLLLICAIGCFAQKNKEIPNIPPQYLEMMKQYMPPGTKLPDEVSNMMNQQQNSGTDGDLPSTLEPLVPIQPVQEYSYSSESTAGLIDYSPFGSGRSESERKMALMNVETELEKLPLILPSIESIPTTDFMLQMAEQWNKTSKQKFLPDDLSDYSKTVIWIPRFDGILTNPKQAKENSMLVALATNNKPAPYFNIAFASAVFSLDPKSSFASNNLASAILSGGELITEKNPANSALAPYRRDAEFGYLYAIFHSMKDSVWSEEILTPAINLGNLCIDLGKLDEARSLFMVARKIKPESWDAALGLAAYFLALNQRDKALAILEDDNLDKPVKYSLGVKAKKSLEKSEPFADLPPESPYEKYEEGINIMSQEPILTSADYITQLDQSERNKMRYFIEHLPVQGSYSAPKINKLTQYASLQAISSPQGVSALNDFAEMLGVFTLGSYASVSNQQMEWLEKMGMKVEITGVDMDDVAKHPEKYAGKDMKAKAKVTGKEEFMRNIESIKKDAQKVKLELAAGKTEGLTKIVSRIDSIHAILLMNPDDYADPMNIIMQKMNYTVYQRKNHLYRGYLYSLNKKTYNQITEIITQTQRKLADLSKICNAEIEELDKKKEAKMISESTWKLQVHAVHMKYFNASNNYQSTAFGSATNVVSSIYMNNFKPTVEKFYYDVFRHIALISDPEVRDQKNADLKNSINQVLTWYLQTVLMAHGSFKYSDDWDCGCSIEELEAARTTEREEMDKAEDERIAKNKNAKAVFDSGEIPESSPLFKRLDAYVDEYNFILVKVRASCARTVVEANTDFLPNNLPFNFHYKSTESENTGAITRSGGIKAGLEKSIGEGAGKVSANLNMDVSVSSDGNGVVKDYSVTGGASAGVKVGNFNAEVGLNGTMTSKNGVTDYSATATGKVNTSVKYGNTTVSGGAEFSYSSKNGLDTDFSAGVKQDMKNEYGGSGKFEMNASTKRGCSMSGKIEQTLDPAKKVMDKVNDYAGEKGLEAPSDFVTKSLWNGKYEYKSKN